jgi:hypothetical protein
LLKKKAMIEVHFNWIFILIAGAVIFVFFINIVNKQREFSDIRTSGTIATNLESILTGAQISTDTVNIIDLPKVNIGFECERYFIGPTPKQTKSNVIFAPNLLKGTQMISWALDWNMPYRITNFLYLTDPELRYIIVNKADRPGQLLFDELPEEVNKELIELGNIGNFIDKNNFKVKFIFFDSNDAGPLTKLTYMKDEDVTAIVIKDFTSSTIIPPTGKIEFYQKDGLVWQLTGTSDYLKKESLIGAIFAEDWDTFNCVMKKAFKKLNLVSKVYLERSETLETAYAGTNCAPPYSTAIINLENLRDSSEKQTQEFPTSSITMDAMQDYATNIGSSSGNANNLAQLYSCALIY